MKLTIDNDKLTLETRLNTYSINRAPLEAEDAWYDFTEFAVLNLWYSDGEYKAAVYPVTDAGDVMHEYGTKVEDVVMVEKPVRRVVVEHDIFSLEDDSPLPPIILPAGAFGDDFDKYEGDTLIHEEGLNHGVPVRYKQTFMYTKRTDKQLLELFKHKR